MIELEGVVAVGRLDAPRVTGPSALSGTAASDWRGKHLPPDAGQSPLPFDDRRAEGSGDPALAKGAGATRPDRLELFRQPGRALAALLHLIHGLVGEPNELRGHIGMIALTFTEMD